jgi:hypothetical protein
MTTKSQIIITERIEQKILLLRGKKIMLDRDLATLYGVETKTLNQAVKRNIKRFPNDFMSRLSRREINEVVTNCDHLHGLKFSHSLPYAFTEQGVAMLSSVLNSERAIAVNIHIIRVFTRLRELMIQHKDLEHRLTTLEKKYDLKFKNIFDAIRQLLEPPLTPPKQKLPIGFHAFGLPGQPKEVPRQRRRFP